MLYVLDGMDGTGKTTIINLLHEHFKDKYKIEVECLPGSKTIYFGKLREYLKSYDLKPYLSYKDKALAFLSEMIFFDRLISLYKPGYIILLDRYKYSTYVFQYKEGSKNLSFLDKLFIRSILKSLRSPTKTFILYADIKTIKSRIKKDGTRESKDAFESVTDKILKKRIHWYKNLHKFFKKDNIYYYDTTNKTIYDTYFEIKDLIEKDLSQNLLNRG